MRLRVATLLSLLGAYACATPSRGPTAPEATSVAPVSERYRCQVRLILPNGLTRQLESDLDRTLSATQLTERAELRGTTPDPLYPGYLFSAQRTGDHVQAKLGSGETLSGSVTGEWTRYSVRGGALTREERQREERLEIETTQQREGDSGLTRTVEDCLPERLVPPPFKHP